MNPNFERAMLLYQQARYDLAETELRQSLAADPDDAHAHALLGLCLLERQEYEPATEEARQAIHLTPDFSFGHYAFARILLERNHVKEARVAIEEAIRLDPADADYFAMLANIHLVEKRWQEALAAAEQGLRFDPEHIGCTNLRAMAMVKLGRRAEAGTTIDAALSKAPENSFTHANQGWTYLESGESKKALEHFRESLRLDPSNEWARSGIVEALKSRNFIYALVLKYFFWMSRFPPNVQFGIIIGGYIGNRILSGIARSNPDLAPWLLPLRVLYITFALMTWVADPLFNLMLRVNRFGRYALSREQTVASNWFGACVLLALIGVAGAVWRGFNMDNPWMLMALVFGVLLIPLSGTFKCAPGWPRNSMAVYTGLMALAGIVALFCVFVGDFIPHRAKLLRLAGTSILLVFMFGAIGSGWVANILMSMRPKK